MRTAKRTAAFFIFIIASLTVFMILPARNPAAPPQITALEEAFISQFKAVQKDLGPFPILPLLDMQDQEHLLTTQDHTILINFWASWCAPCITEIPSLQALEKQLSPQLFRVVYISLDHPKNAQELTALMTQFNIPDISAYYVRDKTIWNQLAIKALPTSFLVSPQGEIKYKMMGDINWNSTATVRFLNAILDF